jgi:hypothetical protein
MLLVWAAAVLVIVAAVISLRWASARYDTLGRRRPFPWVAVGTCVVAGIVALVPWVMRIRLEHRLGSAASVIAGSEVSIHCQTFGEAFVDAGAESGYVAFGPTGVPERRALIKRNQCNDLGDYIRSDKRAPTREHVVAVHVLTHEAIHMSGETSEAITECLAMQKDAAMARLLGADDASARLLARSYFESIYPSMPEPYRSAECGPGLALDAGRPDAPWATATGAMPAVP